MDRCPRLATYYGRVFPTDIIHRWLSYEHENNLHNSFTHREISFTLSEDIYLRYNAFENGAEFGKRLSEKTPIKVDIGAEYQPKPAKSQSHALVPIRKELVFDIDLTDYDDIRSCCVDDNVCMKCWKFIVVASKILNRYLRNDFGFKHILWVYSGRRGIHCWVCDKNARLLSETDRIQIINYISLIGHDGNIIEQKKSKLFHSKDLPPCIKQSLNIINEYFVQSCVIDQNILGTNTNIAKFLKKINIPLLDTVICKLFNNLETSLERWNAFIDFIENCKITQTTKIRSNFLVDEVKILYAYPRFDVNVTKSMKHLLKAPFCVHPKTDNVSIPFEISQIDQFDIANTPRLDSIFQQIDNYEMRNQKYEVCSIFKEGMKTQLKKPLLIFNHFVSILNQMGGN